MNVAGAVDRQYRAYYFGKAAFHLDAQAVGGCLQRLTFRNHLKDDVLKLKHGESAFAMGAFG